jgi:hypothetical protein
MPPSPNILFVMADQFRADALDILNGWTPTAALDALARDGVLFRRVFTNSADGVPPVQPCYRALPSSDWCPANDAYALNPRFPNWMQARATLLVAPSEDRCYETRPLLTVICLTSACHHFIGMLARRLA